MKKDKLDASGFKPLDIKMIDGKFMVAVVTALTVGKEEYITALRWHLPKTRKQIALVRRYINAMSDIAAKRWE